MKFTEPCCMFPVKRVLKCVEGVVQPVDIMCGNSVPFPFQSSCSLHYFYLSHGVTKDWIFLNECHLLNKNMSVDVYDKLCVSFATWQPLSDVEELGETEECLFFDRIQKIWFSPSSGLGYDDDGKVAYFRHANMFRPIKNFKK